MISFMTFVPALANLGLTLIGALVAYYVVVQKLDDNQKLRDSVFMVIISILLGSVAFSVLSDFISSIVVATRMTLDPFYAQLYRVFNAILYLGMGAIIYWCSRDISINFSCSEKQYRVVKVISAIMLGWIAKDVIMLMISLLSLFSL